MKRIVAWWRSHPLFIALPTFSRFSRLSSLPSLSCLPSAVWELAREDWEDCVPRQMFDLTGIPYELWTPTLETKSEWGGSPDTATWHTRAVCRKIFSIFCNWSWSERRCVTCGVAQGGRQPRNGWRKHVHRTLPATMQEERTWNSRSSQLPSTFICVLKPWCTAQAQSLVRQSTSADLRPRWHRADDSFKSRYCLVEVSSGKEVLRYGFLVHGGFGAGGDPYAPWPAVAKGDSFTATSDRK